MADSSNLSNSALPAITPTAIRNELTDVIVKDLLGPAGGADEELDQREDRVYGSRREHHGGAVPTAERITRRPM